MSCQIRSPSNGSWPTTSGVTALRMSFTTRRPSGPWNRNGPWASPMPTSPASVVSLTMTSLTRLIAAVDVRTTCGNGADRKYVSIAVTFMEPSPGCGRESEEAAGVLPHELPHGGLAERVAPGDHGVGVVREDRLGVGIVRGEHEGPIAHHVHRRLRERGALGEVDAEEHAAHLRVLHRRVLESRRRAADVVDLACESDEPVRQPGVT